MVDAAAEDEEVLVLLVLVDLAAVEVVEDELVPHWVPKKKQFHQL